MVTIPHSRRSWLVIAALIGLCALFLLHTTLQPSYPWLATVEPNVGSLLCSSDPFEEEYGRDNLRLSRAYEGSQFRLRRFLQKMQDGPVTISAIGGSVTKGHQVNADEIWFYKLGEWFKEMFHPEITLVNGAAPATGSDYFSFCFPLHISLQSDLVLIELAINDEGILEHIENMENLLRGLLDLPNKPAVVLVEAIAFSTGGMGGGGGRMHLPVAQYYDVPVINQRHPLVNHFARHPELVKPYFSSDWWGNPDTRHMNAHGHRDLGRLIASMIRDMACAPPTSTGTRSLDEPAIWMQPEEYGQLPRLRVLQGWDPNLEHVVPPFHPTCMSTRSKIPEYNLTAISARGWDHWVHPDFQDKPYLLARKPGSVVTFRLATSVGVVKMYSLKSRSFGLGSVECWADDERSRAVRIDGYWDKDPNIGRFETIRSDLSPGDHDITCELLDETNDPDGGTEFRIISVMSV